MKTVDLQVGDIVTFVTIGDWPTRWIVEYLDDHDDGFSGLLIRPIDPVLECTDCGHPMDRHSWFGCMVKAECSTGCHCPRKTMDVSGRKVWR